MAVDVQTRSSTGQSAPGAPSTSGAPSTPDGVVDRILARTKSPLEKGEARKLVEALEKVSKECLPMNWYTQPADDRCCGLAIR